MASPSPSEISQMNGSSERDLYAFVSGLGAGWFTAGMFIYYVFTFVK